MSCVCFDQTYIGGNLYWHESRRCSECNLALEMDDVGFPPDEIRSMIIAESGLWRLTGQNDTEKINSVRIVRNALKLPLKESQILLARFPELYQGTKVECEWLHSILSSEDLATSISNCGRAE